MNLLSGNGQRAGDAEGHADEGAVGGLDDLLLDGQQPDEVLQQCTTHLQSVSELEGNDFSHPVEVEHLSKGSVVDVRFAKVVKDGPVSFLLRRGMRSVKPRQEGRGVANGGRHGSSEFRPNTGQTECVEELSETHGSSFVHFSKDVGGCFFSDSLEVEQLVKGQAVEICAG